MDVITVPKLVELIADPAKVSSLPLEVILLLSGKTRYAIARLGRER